MLTKVERLPEKVEYFRLNVEDSDVKGELSPKKVEKIAHKVETPSFANEKHPIFV